MPALDMFFITEGNRNRSKTTDELPRRQPRIGFSALQVRR